MKTIEYRVEYTGATGTARSTMTDDGTHVSAQEYVKVQAININSGFTKALKVARQPLGNGRVREIGGIEFWQVV